MRTRKVMQRLEASDGVVLIWALLIVLVLGITSTSAITLVTSNESAFGRDNQSISALDVAEAGLNAASSALRSVDSTTTTLSHSGTLQGGTWSYTATRTQDDPNDSTKYTWTIVSTGVAGGLTHIVEEKIGETVTPTSTTSTTTTTVPASGVYGYGVYLGATASDCTAGGSGGNVISGSGVIRTSIYVAGSLCVSGGAGVQEPATSGGGTVSMYIGNKLKSSGEAAPFGTSAKMLKQATVVVACLAGNVAVVCSKQGNPTSNANSPGYGSGVWATTYSSSQAPITKPPADTGWYSNAKPGPAFGCNNDPTNSANVSTYPNDSQTGTLPWSYSKFMSHMIDGDSTRNTSVGNVDPFELVNNFSQVMNSFDCRYYDSSGNLIGRLAWVYPATPMGSSSPGQLYISGTVFIDGNLSLSGSDYAVYHGIGTIYVNGTVTMSGGTKLCAQPISGTPCLGNFDPKQNLLGIVAMNSSNATTGWNISGSGTFEGVGWVNKQFISSGGSAMNGVMVADTGNISGGAAFVSTIDPPPGFPGASSTTTTTTTTGGPSIVGWTTLPGSWQQIQ